MRKPNFFVIGAAKAGTTSLHRALQQHPDVFMCEPKEPHYFAYVASPALGSHLFPGPRRARRRYRRLFADAGDAKAIGDASTSNLVVAGTARAIRHEVPDARIIAVLRNPVDRAFAHYRQFLARGAEHLDFLSAARTAPERIARGEAAFTYDYLGWGRYTDRLREYFDAFGRERILIHLYDDFRTDPAGVVSDTFAFVDVDPDVAVAIGQENAILRAEYPNGVVPVLTDDIRAELASYYADEITRLEQLLGRDLAAWR